MTYDFRLRPDSGGDDAAYVTVVLADRPNHELYSSDDLFAFESRVWDEFTSRGIERIPYFSFRQEHEPVDDALDEDEEEDGAR